MSGDAVRIAVVGHTNVGKTSLLRTLSRDQGFGEVSSRPSTTRQVEGARLLVDGQALVELYDTPGLEEPIALLELIESQTADSGERRDGPARIAAFLATAAADGRFAQEAKVLRQMLASDAAFVVIDVRDPVLAKHRDELALLAACAVPLLPVLNFVRADSHHERDWREVLARCGLHAAIRFDTVAPERDAEQRLYEALGTILESARDPLQRLLDSRQREQVARHAAAARLIAEMLIDVAAARLEVDREDAEAVRTGRERLSAWVRAREQLCVEQMLELYRFADSSLQAEQLPLVDGRWAEDVFHPEAIKAAGVRLGSGAAAGAAAGVGIDLISAGMTLGAAAALGALAGGGAQAARHYGRRWLGRIRGIREFSVDDPRLRLLGLRALALREALEGRGHAATGPITAASAPAQALRDQPLAPSLRRARAHPQWSSLVSRRLDDEQRQQATAELAESLSPD